MKRFMILVLAGVAVLAAPVQADSPPKDTKDAVSTAPTCPKEETASRPESHVDFSGSTGLVFDPLAPGGARPADSLADQQHPFANPGTVTLAPLPQQPAPKEEKSNVATKKSCL